MTVSNVRKKSERILDMEAIDFVLTWVDGSDPAWQRTRSQFDPSFDPAVADAHYRDYGTLKYWFRAVEKYAPWVNKIHFVTCGQTPEWLNTEHPKLHLVSHADFMPEKYLPTFSVNPIELNFHKIEGLAEQFVYFNDDTFLTAPTTPEDFFKGGLPCDSAELAALIPSAKNEVITYILFNDLLLINANFNKRQSMKGQLRKWFSLAYGKGVLRNLYYLPIGKFSGFVNPHLPNSFLKSTFESVWATEGEILDEVCTHRFRTKADVNQYLMRYWQLASGTFIPRKKKVGACYTVGNDNAAIEAALRGHKYKLLCINDNSTMDDIAAQMSWLCGVFEDTLGEKCAFEK